MMNTQLPLQLPIGHWVKRDEYTANEPPQLYRTVEAFPTLKERLQYFNDNIRSLALSTKDATYWGWYKKVLRVYSPEPCKCGKCRVFTDTDKMLFEKMRAAEVKRLEKELDKRQTYGEKVAYLITQRGFGLSRLEIAEFDLRPDNRSAEDVAAFNELSKAAFEERYLPELYNGLRFEKERTRISLQIKEALNPQSIISAYRKEIIQYVGFDPQDDSGQSYLDAKERLYPTPPTDPIAAAQWDGERIMNCTRDIEAKRAFLDLAGAEGRMPNLSKKPLSDADWEALEHGRQVYELYRWLAAWKPGEDVAPEPEAERAENVFCKAMPIDAARKHFRKLVDKERKNGRPHLTETALEAFIKRAFLGDTTIPKQVINFNPSREKGFIIDVFYGLYQTANEPEKEWEDTPQCRDKYINLLVENFEGWDFDKVKNNFRSK